MALNVRVPQPLRGLTGNLSIVPGAGGTLGECITHLEANHPGMRARILEDAGDIRRFVNLYINGEDVRFMEGLASPLKDGDEISIVPAVAGG